MNFHDTLTALAKSMHEWPEYGGDSIVFDGRIIIKDQWIKRRNELGFKVNDMNESTLVPRDESDFVPFVSVEDGEVKPCGAVDAAKEYLAKCAERAAATKQQAITPSKYTKTIHGVSIDVYDVLQAWGVTNPALQHLIKKALQCGQRGHKDNAQDLQDIIDSAIRAKELEL